MLIEKYIFDYIIYIVCIQYSIDLNHHLESVSEWDGLHSHWRVENKYCHYFVLLFSANGGCSEGCTESCTL